MSLLLCRLFSSQGKQGLVSSCGAVASHCSCFSCCRAGALGLMGSVIVVLGVQSTGSIVVAQGLSCSTACGIFLDQRLNPCLLHWQADSLPLAPPGKHHKFSSVQFSYSVVSNSLKSQGLQHAMLPCPSTPGASSNSCPSSQSIVPFSFRLQPFPASGSFPMSQFFVSGSQSIGVSASASVLSMNIQDWFPLGWTGYISFQAK